MSHINDVLKGSIVAMVTPLDTQGRVDKAGLRKLVDYHVAAGTSAIVAVGTTGESATLSHQEHVGVGPATLGFAGSLSRSWPAPRSGRRAGSFR